MTNLQRLTGKIFGETATATGDDPEIGQFGSALAGTYVGTTDVATIQSLPAWSNGFIDSVTPATQFPPLPEMTGFGKVLSYQNAYLLQKGVAEWDSGTTYYAGDFCKGVGEGKLYISKVDGNINNAVTNGTYWEEFTSGAFRNIGEIVTSTIPLTDADLHLLDGALINGSGIYSNFVTYIANLYTADPTANYFTTEADWQTAVSTYGVCGKFVYDSVNNTVRLPKYSNKIYTQELDAAAPVVGNGMTMGLTDGTNNYGLTQWGASVTSFGSTGGYGTGIGNAPSGTGSIFNKTIGITSDGSKSGIIADLANITSSVDCYYYIVVATSTKTDIEVDIDEIATDLNGKADVDLTNTVPAQSFINSSMGWTRIDFANGISLTINSDYTCPSDGCLYVRSVHVEGAEIPKLTINSTTFDTAIASGGYVDTSTFFVSVSKNDVVKLSTGYTNQQLIFFPLKGV